MKIVFAGGGTGGHFCPGLAVAEELARRDPDARFLFLCTERDEGYIADFRFPISDCPAQQSPNGQSQIPDPESAIGNRQSAIANGKWQMIPLSGRQSGSLPRRLASLAPAAVRAFRGMRRFRPDAVVGLGGYGSLAPVACAAVLRIPSILLEQNVVPGRSNRWLAHVASEVACQWKESVAYFRGRASVGVTGNPIRSHIRRRDRATVARTLGLSPDAPTLLVAGGSQGARPINDLVLSALPLLVAGQSQIANGKSQMPVQFVHLAGRADRERVAAVYEQHGARAAVFGFLDDMSLAYSACDLALSRAGGTSIAELTALGIPSLLVPYPYAADDHQSLNAGVLGDHRGAIVLEQATLSPRRLAQQVLDLFAAPPRLELMARRSRLLGVPTAASIVADRVEGLARCRCERSVPASPAGLGSQIEDTRQEIESPAL